jgi:hypothetical protein
MRKLLMQFNPLCCYLRDGISLCIFQSAAREISARRNEHARASKGASMVIFLSKTNLEAQNDEFKTANYNQTIKLTARSPRKINL